MHKTHLAAALAVVLAGGSIFAWAQVTGSDDALLPYQGRLELAGVPQSGFATLSFELFDAETGGTLLWGPEAHTDTPLTAGAFSVQLGSVEALPRTVAQSPSLFLAVAVNGTPLQGRQRLLSSFSSLRAGGLEMHDPQTGATFRLTADEETFAEAGATLHAVGNVPNGAPLLRVLSSAGAERLRVEHNGETSTTNDFRVVGDSTVTGTLTTDGLVVDGDASVTDLEVTGTLTANVSGSIVAGATALCNGSSSTLVSCEDAFGGAQCSGCDVLCPAGSTARRIGFIAQCYRPPTSAFNGACHAHLCIAD